MDVNQGIELDNSEVDVADNEVESLDSLKSKLDLANAEAAKYRKQKNDAVKERDTLKKTRETEETKSWEALYKASQEENAKMRDGSKKQAITAAIRDALVKQGVLTDALADASKLVDVSMVSWDSEDGVDAFSVESAVKALRGSSKYLFETKIAPTGDPKNPKSGSTKSDSEISRKEFDAISDPVLRAKTAVSKRIID